MTDPFPINLDLKDGAAVCRVLADGAEANRDAGCRRGSIDLIRAPGMLIATGDLHDHPLHLARLMQAARLMPGSEEEADRQRDGVPTVRETTPIRIESSPPPLSLDAPTLEPSPVRLAVPSPPSSHLILHEVIHSDRLLNGMDFSYRMLARVALLKALHPERVHVLLANHELSQMAGAGIVKDGVRVVEAFNEGVACVFGDAAADVDAAVKEFVRSMPLALRCHTPRGDILCAHSLPAPWAMQRFDAGVLTRDLTDADYEPRQGAAHLMVWGRGYDAEQIEDLVERWGVTMFILGHEHVDEGARFVPPCAVVLNSDHERGVYLPIDLSDPPRPSEAPLHAVRLTG